MSNSNDGTADLSKAAREASQQRENNKKAAVRIKAKLNSDGDPKKRDKN
jgi:hypothetical protein